MPDPDPHDYTIGWICATTTEYVPACAFLDQEHETPEFMSPLDTNMYTLGRVGKHNVVIAVFAASSYGSDYTTRVAMGMLHSFPNIRICLLIGIGGGTPSGKHDIRLGDVVVSAPRDGNSGVIKYDFSKATRDGRFRTLPFPNQPPTVLRAAVNQLERKGHQIKRAITDVFREHPRLRETYRRPDPDSDRLYRSVVVHPSDPDASCKTICGDEPSKLVLRPARTEEDDDPAVHYGLVATAHQLVTNAKIRDTLAAEDDVVCFESQAAGLINNFPCLIICGICDYADTHSNDKWRTYAALTAAAYARDLVRQLAPSRVEAETSISHLLSGLDKVVAEQLELAMTQIQVQDDSLQQRRHIARGESRLEPSHGKFHVSTPAPPLGRVKPASIPSAVAPSGDLCASLLGFLFHQTTLIAILLLLGLLSGIMVSIAVQQAREPPCTPRLDTLRTDDGFWTLLSQLFLQMLSVFCTLYPVILNRELKVSIANVWFLSLLAVSLAAAVGAVAAYSWSWQVAVVLSFVMSFAQIISAGQLAVSLHSIDGRCGRVGRRRTLEMEER